MDSGNSKEKVITEFQSYIFFISSILLKLPQTSVKQVFLNCLHATQQLIPFSELMFRFCFFCLDNILQIIIVVNCFQQWIIHFSPSSFLWGSVPVLCCCGRGEQGEVLQLVTGSLSFAGDRSSCHGLSCSGAGQRRVGSVAGHDLGILGLLLC